MSAITKFLSRWSLPLALGIVMCLQSVLTIESDRQNDEYVGVPPLVFLLALEVLL